MLRLNTNDGRSINANVFIEEGEQAVGIVLYESGNAIAAYRINVDTKKHDALKATLDWSDKFDFTCDDGSRFIETIMEEFSSLRTIAKNGPDISQDWPGSHHSRRIPEDLFN